MPAPDQPVDGEHACSERQEQRRLYLSATSCAQIHGSTVRIDRLAEPYDEQQGERWKDHQPINAVDELDGGHQQGADRQRLNDGE